MAFSVSYVFTARDKYTAIARKVAAANEKIRRSAVTASRAISTKLSPALTSIRSKAQRTKIQIASLAKTIKTKFEPTMRSVRNIGLGLSVAITLPFVLAARSATRAASDAEETRSKFATIFKDISNDSESVADSFAKNFGLAGTTARMLLGDTADILTGFGFTQKGALDLANQVNELAVDLASFTNFAGGAEGASAALTKALLGERESLKSLGIAITEDLVKKKIATLLSQGARFASLAEAKARATLAIAVEQSGNAIGDYARTQNAAANVSRRLGQRVIELKETFGRILLPISVKINNALIKFIDVLNTLSPRMQRIILIVGGVLAALGPLLLIIGAIGLALPAIAAGFGLIGAAMVAMTGPIGLVAILIASIVLFMSTSEKARQVVGGAMFKIVGFFKSMGAAVGEVLFKIVTIVSSAADLIGAALGKIGDFISPVVAFIDGLIASVIDRIKGALNFLGGVFDKFKGLAASIGLIDLPDQEVALTLVPPAALEPQEITAKLIPPANLPDQQGVIKSQINNLITASPQVATANANATVNGQINVSASPGSQIDSISQEAFRGVQGNVGLGVAAQ